MGKRWGVKWAVLFLGVQDHRHWGKLNFFDVWQMGEVIVLIYGKWGGGVLYENIHLNAGQGLLRVQLVIYKISDVGLSGFTPGL